LLGATVGASGLAVLDATTVNVALPAIRTDLDATVAGLMVLTFILDATASGAVHAAGGSGAGAARHAMTSLASLPPEPPVGIAATLVHTAGYVLITGLVAVIVYEKLGLRFLRSAWINVDALWAGALIVTAVLTPLL
jgi:hypothetical protein